MQSKVGIIGGSGLDKASFFTHAEERIVHTAWGDPSAPLKEGLVGGVPVVQLARHGLEHTIPPSQVNYRANIQALKDAGCTCILATTAVGSLREEIERGDLIIVDQFIDFTRQRKMTYFESFASHEAKHTAMPDPFDTRMRRILFDTAMEQGVRCHPTGTVVTIEGPRFSTRAESRMFRLWGADIINMSIATEAMLAAELQLPYAAVAMSTDYDCWREDTEDVSWEQILQVFSANAEHVIQLLLTAIPRVAENV